MWLICILAAIICGTSLSHEILLDDDVVLNFTKQFKKLVDRVYADRPFESVFVQRRDYSDCITEDLEKLFDVPVLIWSPYPIPIPWKVTYNREILSILCLTGSDDQTSILKLAASLRLMRDVRLLVIVNRKYRHTSEWKVAEFFEICMSLRILNVLMFYRNYPLSGVYQSYTQFPQFKLENRSLNQNDLVFPDRLANTNGKTLLTLPDQIVPRSMLYTNKEGQQKIGGYVGNLMRLFALKHNFTLAFPYNLSNDHIIYVNDVRDAVRNNSIEIGTSLSAPQHTMNIHEYTYPIEISKWLTMIPVESILPTDWLLIAVFDLNFMACTYVICLLFSIILPVLKSKSNQGFRYIKVTDILLNDAAIRGVIGQPFSMRSQLSFGEKFVHMLLLITGLFFVTSYVANLTNLLTKPPTVKPITSFDDVLQRKFKILLSEEERQNILFFTGIEFWNKYESAFTMVKRYSDFQSVRKSMDPRFGYPVTVSIWWAIDEQQKFYARKLFRLSDDLAYNKFLYMAMPINENSFYKDLLNRLIFQAFETGLFNSWYSSMFYELIQSGKLSHAIPPNTQAYNALSVKDFYWVWVAYGIAIGICFSTFIIEICYFKRYSKRHI